MHTTVNPAFHISASLVSSPSDHVFNIASLLLFFILPAYISPQTPACLTLHPPPTLNLQSLTTASVWPAGVTLLLHRTQATLSGCRRAYGGWRGWGRESRLTQHHRPQPGRHGQRELVCQFQTLLLPPLGLSCLSIHPSSLSLPI